LSSKIINSTIIKYPKLSDSDTKSCGERKIWTEDSFMVVQCSPLLKGSFNLK